MTHWKEVWITGNGPSGKDFNPAGRTGVILTLNESAVRIHASGVCITQVVFSLDANWVHKRREFLAAFQGEKYVALPLETFPMCAGIPDVQYLRWSYAEGLSDDPEVVCTGCNSGYAAINLAYLKGARLIHLIGYDMNPLDNDQYQYWAPRFRTMLPQLRAKGVEVWNHNKQSFIDAFPKCSMNYKGI